MIELNDRRLKWWWKPLAPMNMKIAMIKNKHERLVLDN